MKMDCCICGREILPNFHLVYRGEGVCFHCAAYLEGVTKMEEKEDHIIHNGDLIFNLLVKVVKRIDSDVDILVEVEV